MPLVIHTRLTLFFPGAFHRREEPFLNEVDCSVIPLLWQQAFVGQNTGLHLMYNVSGYEGSFLWLQSVNYFLDTTRMATSTYFWHFLDIIRSKIGQPLLEGLAAMPEKFEALLTAEPDPTPQARVIEVQFPERYIKIICITTVVLSFLLGLLVKKAEA